MKPSTHPAPVEVQVNRYSLTHLSNSALDAAIQSVAARERMTTADLLAHIAESDVRKRYVSAGYPSMFAYCQGRLRLSEQAAYKRITVARVARKFPIVFEVVASGRVHLSGMTLLAPHLTPENIESLLVAATHGSRRKIEALIAQRFPKADVPTRIQPILEPQLSPGRVGMTTPEHSTVDSSEPRHDAPLEVPPLSARPAPPARVKPLAPERFGLQTTIDQETRELLEHAQNLLGHRGPDGIADVLKLALGALVEKLEKRKFSATSKPRPAEPVKANSRHIPAHVQRAVWARDGGQCTFTSADGHRCEARSDLEFDHVIPVARGGRATTDNIRLLCSAHNQYVAELTYGAQFMNGKRRAS